MNQYREGFTLLELMIVIVIIGVLASLAISAYQTFTVRDQVAEGLDAAASAQAPVIAAHTQNGIAPANRLAAEMTAAVTDTRGSFVQSVAIVHGRVDVTFGGPQAHADIIGRTLSFTPYKMPDNTIVWRCGSASAPAGSTLLRGGAEHIAPTVELRYLPGECR